MRSSNDDDAGKPVQRRPDFIYSVGLLAAALTALTVLTFVGGPSTSDYGIGTIAFFLVFGLKYIYTCMRFTSNAVKKGFLIYCRGLTTSKHAWMKICGQPICWTSKRCIISARHL